MRTLIEAATATSLVAGKATVGAVLVYTGVALRKTFPVAFGAAVLLMTAAQALDTTWAAGLRADIVISLMVTALFALCILLATTPASEPKVANTALFIATLGGFYAVINGVSTGALELYELFDASTSALVTLALGGIVSLQAVRKRPILASMLAVATVSYTLMQTVYFRYQSLDGFNLALQAMTVVYAGLLGSAYVVPRMDGTPPSAFAPSNVFKIVQDAVSVGLEAAKSRLTSQRRNG